VIQQSKFGPVSNSRVLLSSATVEDPSAKKSRIDAIWADMNTPAASKKMVKSEPKTETNNEKCAAVSAKDKQQDELLR
jgi:hypothetical protein